MSNSKAILQKQLHTITNGIITPTVYDPAKNIFTGGVYNQQGELCQPAERSHLMSNVRFFPQLTIDPATECSEKLMGTTLYLGHYTHFYGHFLMGTLARFWTLEDNPTFDQVVFHTLFDNTTFTPAFSPAKTVFDCFGIRPEQIKVIQKPVQVEKLIVPSKLIAVSDSTHPDQAKI